MDKINRCVQHIQRQIEFTPAVAVVLGSGLGYFAEEIEKVAEVAYADIPGVPQSTVEGHQGKFIFGYVGEIPVVLMQGRVHYYEGYTMEDVVLPIRVMRMLGAQKLILTNAAGGINHAFKVGDFMLITDHISSFVPSPLIGANKGALGPRFPDMTDVYDAEFREEVRAIAADLGIGLQEGVYVQLSGPNYETPAEIKMYQALGIDAVGMSTVCEAMVANHMGMKICGISCITNMASGIAQHQLSHAEVQETAERVSDSYKKLIKKIINKI